LEITYFGRSAFRLRGKDVSVVTDPHAAMPKVSPDIVTLSNGNGKPEISFDKSVRIVSGPGEYEVADILIAGVATAQEPARGATNTAYVLRFDDLAICHLGKLGADLTDKQVEELGDIDILMVPAGGKNDLTPTKAAEVVAQLEPSVVIPMDYSMEPATDSEPVELFCREMGVKEIVPEPKLNVVRGNLGQTVRVVVLEQKSAAGSHEEG
jgi:L-ascorbate metabolism protein UlaG (beta-lactamase superfamily)